jgi:(p)ppGpp synthase/HD superfamily hydrolase
MVLLAERIARHAHRHQTDRSGTPMIDHVEHVVANLLRR